MPLIVDSHIRSDREEKLLSQGFIGRNAVLDKRITLRKSNGLVVLELTNIRVQGEVGPSWLSGNVVDHRSLVLHLAYILAATVREFDTKSGEPGPENEVKSVILPILGVRRDWVVDRSYHR